MNLKIELARPADDAALRTLLRESPMPGPVEVAFLREPSYFDALSVEGRHSDVVVARDVGAGRLAAAGNRSIREAFVNGRPSPLGYLSGLRLHPAYRGGTILARGYRFFRRCHADGRARLYTTTIVAGNASAQRILPSARTGLPRYHDAGRFHCMAIGLDQPVRGSGAAGVHIREATPADAGLIADFLQAEGRRRQFFPVYTAEDLLSPAGLLRGLAPRDIMLAFSGPELAGTLASWNQGAYRQAQVRGYARPLRAIRPLYNATAGRLGYPRLPRPGARLRYRSLALCCVRGDSMGLFALLLAAVMRHARADGDFIMAGCHERDALLPALLAYRHFSYTSRLYVVCMEDGEQDVASLDGRVPYLELGSL